MNEEFDYTKGDSTEINAKVLEDNRLICWCPKCGKKFKAEMKNAEHLFGKLIFVAEEKVKEE